MSWNKHKPNADSDTAPKQKKTNGKPFVKGDPRINRGGRPKTFDKLRAMVREVLNEKIPLPNGETTRLNVMLNSMATSGAPADHKTLLEYGFGKVKDELEVSEKDIDHAIGAELAKLAHRAKAKDVGTVTDADQPTLSADVAPRIPQP